MIGPYFSRDGRLLPVEEAVVGLDDINYSYGFGVYETVKVRHRILYFPEQHEARLFRSARVIGLEHTLLPGQVVGFLNELGTANRLDDANIKVMMIGGDRPEDTRLFILCLNPLFPRRQDYRDGGLAILYRGERAYPNAKTLNMLVSTLAYREARRVGAYDALFLNSDDTITEGTRTNLFYTDGDRLFTPPLARVLEGVTQATILDSLSRAGLTCDQGPLRLFELGSYAGFALSSTSTKIMPLRRLGEQETGIPDLTRRIMRIYDQYLEEYASGRHPLH